MEQYGKFEDDIRSGRIVSAYALDRHGVIAAVSKMAFGNRKGVKIEHNMDPRDMFAPAFGDIIAEVEDGQVGNLQITYTLIGEVTDKDCFEYGSARIGMDEALEAWTGTLEKVFATKSEESSDQPVEEKLYNASDIHICSHKLGQPTVFIPVFRVQTVNMTVHVHSNVQEPKWLQKYSAIWMLRTSEVLWRSSRKRSDRLR